MQFMKADGPDSPLGHWIPAPRAYRCHISFLRTSSRVEVAKERKRELRDSGRHVPGGPELPGSEMPPPRDRAREDSTLLAAGGLRVHA